MLCFREPGTLGIALSRADERPSDENAPDVAVDSDDRLRAIVDRTRYLVRPWSAPLKDSTALTDQLTPHEELVDKTMKITRV